MLIHLSKEFFPCVLLQIALDLTYLAVAVLFAAFLGEYPFFPWIFWDQTVLFIFKLHRDTKENVTFLDELILAKPRNKSYFGLVLGLQKQVGFLFLSERLA